jgi:hypothetical protein
LHAKCDDGARYKYAVLNESQNFAPHRPTPHGNCTATAAKPAQTLGADASLNRQTLFSLVS